MSNGFKVRAGARNTQKAQDYVDYATSLGLLSGDAAKRLQIVPVDLEDPGSISAALGNATRVNYELYKSQINHIFQIERNFSCSCPYLSLSIYLRFLPDTDTSNCFLYSSS